MCDYTFFLAVLLSREGTRGSELTIRFHGREEEEQEEKSERKEEGLKNRKGGGEKRKDDETRRDDVGTGWHVKLQ